MAQTLVAPVGSEPAEQGPRLLTIEEYERLPARLFPKGEKTELIEGLIYTKMGQNDPHITALAAVSAALQAAFGTGFHLRVQGPLKLGAISKPGPDVSVLRGTWRDYDGRRPDPLTDVPLVVEVSDSTLVEDRGRKARLYAKHGIPEYWIINLRERILEIRRSPGPEGYVEKLFLDVGESVDVGSGVVAVNDVLPKA